jgi:large subunit ribosomal protein L5
MTLMKKIRIEKITLNVGAGKDQSMLEKGMKLLKNLTGVDPIKTITNKRIPSWGLRPGLPVGTKLTIRDKKLIADLIPRLLKAKENKLKKSCFDKNGNVAFGIHEYIDIPDLEYDPSIGIIGFQICITLERPGFSLKRKTLNGKPIGKNHLITQDDSIAFIKEQYNIEVEE